MSKMLASLGVIAAAVVLVIVLRDGSTGGRSSSVKLQPEVLKLGTIAWGTDRRATLRLFNGSKHDVSISSISTDCACAVLDQDRYKQLALRSGERVDIEVVIRADRRPGVSSEA